MAADSALGFLAELAAMKAAGSTGVSYNGSDSDDDKKKKKKKKKGKKKAAKKVTKKVTKSSKSSKSSKPSAKRSSNAADGALGFLAELAAMKAGGSTGLAYNGSDSDDEPRKKKKKKKGTKKGVKGKRGKKGKKAVIIEEEDEKTPEPPSNLSSIEKRRFLLKYARKKLEKRKKARLEIVKLKNKKTENNTNDDSKEQYGKSYVDQFKKELESEQGYIQKKINQNLNYNQDEEDMKQRMKSNKLIEGLGLNLNKSQKSKKHLSLQRPPGRVNHLELSQIDEISLIQQSDKVAMRNQQTMTDPLLFEKYLKEEYGDDINIDISVISGLVESSFKIGYPRELWELEEDTLSPEPSPSKQIRERNRLEKAREEKKKALIAKRRKAREEEKAKRRNINHLQRKVASKLIKSGDFLINFRKKSKWIERTLGINLEYNEEMNGINGGMESSEYTEEEVEVEEEIEIEHSQSPQSIKDPNNNKNDEYKEDYKEEEIIKKIETRTIKKKIRKKKKIKQYIKYRKTFSHPDFKDRAIGNIDFSLSNRDWFCCTYFIKPSMNNRFGGGNDGGGCIAIWNFMLPSNPEYLLKSTNMIIKSHFHPTNPFLIFGTTVSGQILMWDLRNNPRERPVQRTNFSSGHSAPVFTMKFLPNMDKQQVNGVKPKNDIGYDNDPQNILSISNDGGLCIFNTSNLFEKPVNNFRIMGPDDLQHSSTRYSDLILTCFDYQYRDHGNVQFGSDEGKIYKAEIFGKLIDNSVLLPREIIAAHYGPITNLHHFPCQGFNKYYTSFSELVQGLYLTSSYDWTVKLWHNKYNHNTPKPPKEDDDKATTTILIKKKEEEEPDPLLSFDSMNDYIYDVKWNTSGKPGIFACADGEGLINIFDLTQDWKHPVQTESIHQHPVQRGRKSLIAATTLQWTNDSKYLAVGDSDGNVLFYSVNKSVYKPSIESCEEWQRVVENKLNYVIERN